MASLEDEELISNQNSHLQWVPLSLTHVEYPKGDWLGKFFAMISLLPCGIVSGFIALILFRRDLHTIVFFIGTVLNDLLNMILKNILAEERPLQRTVNYTEYGMPSGHSQFSWFFATYVICFVCIRLHHMNNNSTLENVWKTIIVLGCVFFACICSYSRVYLQYHTWSQIFGGTFVGIMFGSFWFTLTHFFLTPFFPMVVSWLSELANDASWLSPDCCKNYYTALRQFQV